MALHEKELELFRMLPPITALNDILKQYLDKLSNLYYTAMNDVTYLKQRRGVLCDHLNLDTSRK